MILRSIYLCNLIWYFTYSNISFSCQIKYEYLYNLSAQEILAHESIGTLLLKYFPPENYYIILLGRSPALIGAWLEARDVKFSHLPLSFRSKMNDDDANLIHEHLDKYLPAPKINNNKNLVLVDYILTGHSILQTKRLLNSFYKNNIKLYLFGLVTKESTPAKKLKNALLIDLDNLDKSGALSQGFFAGKYKDFAKYPSFRYQSMSSQYYQESELDEPYAIISYQNYRQAIKAWSKLALISRL